MAEKYYYNKKNNYYMDIEMVSISKVEPSKPSTITNLKLSVSDLPMLSCHYIQKGLLFPPPPIPGRSLFALLCRSLSEALVHFPALAGTLVTDRATGVISISCNDAGVPFSHYAATSDLSIRNVAFTDSDVPISVKQLFEFDGAVSYEGHFRPLAAFRLTELAADGSVFLGCTVNHAIVDGTSFWNFFNSWAQLCRGIPTISSPPDLRRNFFGDSTAVIKFQTPPVVTFPVDAPLRERIIRFGPDAIRELKSKANGQTKKIITTAASSYEMMVAEMCGKKTHDIGLKTSSEEVSSFQSLCALLWKHVTKARNLPAGAKTTFRMAVNCRHRLDPPVSEFYFGNAIQSVPTVAPAEDVVGREIRWSAGLLKKSVAGHVDGEVRRVVEEWESKPRVFPLGNPDGSALTMGSSPRFPMYDNDFGWGRPVAVRSGKANKFDGKVSAFPTRESDGGVDLEVCLKPETMAALLHDRDFMHYVSTN